MEIKAEDIIDRVSIAKTERSIRPHIRQTPVIEVDATDFGLAAARLSFKLELFQPSRTCWHEMSRQAGVVAASGGNHGAAVAYASMKLGIPAKIFVPTISSPSKIKRIRDYRAELVVTGDRYADALAASEVWAAQSGAPPIHAYDQRETLLGKGTIGLEMEEQSGDVDTLLVAVGGGGLIAGIAAWFAAKVRVVGVEPEAAPTLTMAFKAGGPVDAPAGGIAADSLAPRRVGTLVYPIAKQHVDHVVLVTDDEIERAQLALWETLRVVVEPGGTAAPATIISGPYEPRPRPGEHIGVLLNRGIPRLSISDNESVPQSRKPSGRS
ncbi:MAG TPA: threonine/serine dehydratase [Stellaceae bacterium]|nr:threonine/serine dehydratase [Stellaceae bacterium]